MRRVGVRGVGSVLADRAEARAGDAALLALLQVGQLLDQLWDVIVDEFLRFAQGATLEVSMLRVGVRTRASMLGLG